MRATAAELHEAAGTARAWASQAKSPESAASLRVLADAAEFAAAWRPPVGGGEVDDGRKVEMFFKGATAVAPDGTEQCCPYTLEALCPTCPMSGGKAWLKNGVRWQCMPAWQWARNTRQKGDKMSEEEREPGAVTGMQGFKVSE